jgi:hypothetical protein
MIAQKHKVMIAIYLKGDRLDPSSVSTLLGVAPSQAHYKGQKWLSSTSREVVAKTGLWVLRIEKDSDTIDLKEMIGEIGDKFRGRTTALKSLPDVVEAYVDVFIASEADNEGGGTCAFELSERNLAALTSLELPVQFTLSVVKP